MEFNIAIVSITFIHHFPIRKARTYSTVTTVLFGNHKSSLGVLLCYILSSEILFSSLKTNFTHYLGQPVLPWINPALARIDECISNFSHLNMYILAGKYELMPLPIFVFYVIWSLFNQVKSVENQFSFTVMNWPRGISNSKYVTEEDYGSQPFKDVFVNLAT